MKSSVKEALALCKNGFSISSRYKATRISDDEEVAIKVVSISELQNISKELSLQRSCSHSNIVWIGDCFNWNNKLWVAFFLFLHCRL